MSDARSGYPLTVVFLLLAVVAVLSMLVTSGLRGHTTDRRHKPPDPWTWGNPPEFVPPPRGVTYVDGDLVAGVTIAGGLLGGIGAAFFGWVRRRWSGLLLGIPIGAAVGATCGLLLVMPPSPGSLLAGCGVFMAIAAGLRFLRLNEPPPVDVRDALAEFGDVYRGEESFGRDEQD